MAGKLNVSVECSPLLGPAADERGEGHHGRQAAAEAHRDEGRHLPDGSRQGRIPEPQVLTPRLRHACRRALEGTPRLAKPVPRCSTKERSHCAMSTLHPQETPDMKRIFLKTLLAGAAACGLVGLAPLAQAQDKGLVGDRDADQVVGALDRRRRQHGQGRCKEKGYKTDLQYADDDIPNQLAQIENMITKGAKVLVIAVDRRHHAVQRAAEGRRQGHQGHRLRPADQGLEERRLLRHLRQLPGRRAAGATRSSTALEAEGRQGPVQHRAVRRLAGRQQRVLLLQRRDVGAEALHRQRQAGRAQQADGHGQGRAPCAGTARWRRRAWTTCCRPTTPTRPRRRGAVAVRRPVDRHPVVAEGRRLRHGAAADAGRHRPGRGGAVGQVDHRGRADLDRSSRTRANWPRSRSTWSTRCWPARRPRSTTPRPTTTASRSCRPTC